MATRIHSKRRVGTEVYETELLSNVSREWHGLTNEAYTFHYHNTSSFESSRLLDMCGKAFERLENNQLPLFNMSGVIQVLKGGYAPNIRGESKYCKVVYQVVFCRFGGQKQPNNSVTFEDTLTAGDQGSSGYKTMRQAIDAARAEMINHFYAVRGVRGTTMRWNPACGVQEYILKPYVRKELVAAVTQVDAALATSPVDLDKYKAAAQRLQMDCDALTAIHNASKPCGTTVAILSKESMSGDANAVLPNATWEDLKKLAFSFYLSECEMIDNEADAQIAAINCRRASRLHQEAVKKDAVVDLVCNRSKTVAARLESLNNAYWGYKAQLHGKNLDVYA